MSLVLSIYSFKVKLVTGREVDTLMVSSEGPCLQKYRLGKQLHRSDSGLHEANKDASHGKTDNRIYT